MLDVRRLRLLCDLARLGTIAAVAAAGNFTASAVSQQLSALEREAGVRLLARTGRSVTLTAAGQVLVRHGAAVLAELEQATAALAAVAGGLTGPLRIGAFPTAVRALLPATLVALGRTHPGLELMVTELDPAEVPAALRDRRIDVGLINDYDLVPVRPDPGLDDVPLLDEPVYLATPAGATAAPGEPGRWAFPADGGAQLGGLRDSPWILATAGTLCHTVTVRLCRAAGFSPRARHHADDFATVLSLVAAGQGASIVPAMAIAGALPAGVRLDALATRRRTRIAYRRGAAGHPAVAEFVTAIRESSKFGPSVRPA
jgi:DNA-binding transcriptional LysR family regulator